MTYCITFDAVKTTGEIVTKLTMMVGELPFELVQTPALMRMCVEYAKVNGVKCSYAENITFEKVVSKIATYEMCRELEKRTGVQPIVVNDGSSLQVYGDGEKKEIAEPVLTGPALVYVVID